MTDADTVIRPFERADVPQLLALMRKLAEFEGYIDDFAITEGDLVKYGLGRQPRFAAFVAARGDVLVGMAVTHGVPWTYDMRPRVVLKELYVARQMRGQGIGRQLMQAVAGKAVAEGASKVVWEVLKGNQRAEEFYTGLGGKRDPVWDNWLLEGSRLEDLAGVSQQAG